MFGLEEGIARVIALRRRSTDRLRFGLVKLVVDGSIQGFTARLRWPGYHNGAPNGLWYVAPSELGHDRRRLPRGRRAVAHPHQRRRGERGRGRDAGARDDPPIPGWTIAIRCQHCQMPDPALFRRIKALGICCNLFANHIYYWGEEHIAQTMGLSRAERMDACGTALRLGIPFAIHSDAPVTPLAPLFTAWCAVMRQTATGRVLGEGERIPVADALHAITLGAAYTLRLDGMIGSVEVGKCADFAVLDEDRVERSNPPG